MKTSNRGPVIWRVCPGIIGVMLCLSLACLLAACTKSPEITSISERDVQEMMKNVEAAHISRNVQDISKHLAPFVVITIDARTPIGPLRTQLSRDQYLEELRKGFAQMTEYEYSAVNPVIAIGPGGKTATVEADVVERIVMNGREKKTSTHEKTTLEIVDGKIVVTVLDAVIDFPNP